MTISVDPVAVAATGEDVANLYRLALRREPETEGTIADNAGTPLIVLLQRIFSSDEFVAAVRDPVLQGEVCSTGPAAGDVVAWAAARLPLSRASKVALKACETWLQVYGVLFDDAKFSTALGEASPFRTAGEKAVLRATLQLQGEVAGGDRHGVRGWARWLSEPERPVSLEAWVDGDIVGTGAASVFDPELEQRFPGYGSSAFRIALALDGWSDQLVEVEVREPSSGLTIGRMEADLRRPNTNALQGIRDRLETMARDIDAIRREMPRMVNEISTPLSYYADYHDLWLRDAKTSPHLFSDAHVAIVLDATAAEPAWIEEAVRAAVKQSHAHVSVHLLIDTAHETFVADVRRRLRWSEGLDVDVTVVDLTDQSWSPEIAPSASLVQFASARSVLQGDAALRAAVHLDQNPALDAVYFDEDRLDADAETDVAARARVAPILKPAFDEDMLLQCPYIGPAIMFRRRAWEAVVGSVTLGKHVPDALVLALHRQGGTIGHLPGVLASRRPEAGDDDAEAWEATVQQHLKTVGSDARQVVQDDILGVPTLGRRRIVRPLADGASATIIVPTRDRLDLLKPCLESIFQHEGANRTAMELIIVDHESVEPETRAYFDEIRTRPNVRFIPFAGAFNWALMNNLAAEEAEGQVLVFLNNDTLVVSPDWLDELTAQAMRLDVGAVGNRLIYEDGTLQHGGFVTRDTLDAFLTHEGVGVDGADGGYLGRHALVRETSAVTGACMASRADLFRSSGGFDATRFPIEGNDVDYCFRVRAAGHKVLYTPYATLHHLESKTRGLGATAEQRRAGMAATARLWKRWGARFARDPYYNPLFDRRAAPFSRLRPPSAD